MSRSFYKQSLHLQACILWWRHFSFSPSKHFFPLIISATMSYYFQSFQPYFSQLISYHPTSWSLYTCPYYYTPQLFSINCILTISCYFPHHLHLSLLLHHHLPSFLHLWFLNLLQFTLCKSDPNLVSSNTMHLQKQSIHCHLTWTLNLFPQHIFRHLSILIG